MKTLLNYKLPEKKVKIAVAAAEDFEVLESILEAEKLGFVEPVLFGDEEKIKKIASENKIDISSYSLTPCSDFVDSAEKAVKSVSSGESDFLMKGALDTSILLKAVLNKDWGLRTGKTLSHVFFCELDSYHKAMILSDGGMNVNPDLDRKKEILENAIMVSRAIGNKTTKVAALSAKEKVSESMPTTIDANELKELGKQGYFGEDVIVEGPMAIDLVFSKESAEHKGFVSEVSGDADVLLFPNIEMANGVAKTLTYMAGAESAGIIMGARKPIVLASRADSAETKLNSIILAAIIANHN